MKILIGCLYFFSLTGSEMYVYELAKGLIKLNCEVTIVAEYKGGILEMMGTKENIKIYNFQTLPQNEKFDIIHCQHVPVTKKLIQIFPDTPKICSIHSEMFTIENPVQHISIKRYIAIRPQIKQFMIKNFYINEDQIQIIYNPIDENRFNKTNIKSENNVLFVGSLDDIRKKTIFDLVVYTKQSKKELWIVGKNMSNYLPILQKYPHIQYFSTTLDIEKYVKECGETAGILLGRTTIEGWMCGKSGWIYNVNDKGDILEKKFYEPPSDIENFYSSNVSKQIKLEYEKILL
jgi:glycosyltransferase involved in cell wall biosynthesis